MDERQILDRWIKPGPTSFCPGCLYGIVLNYLAFSLEELEIEPSQLVAVSGIGCAGWISDKYFRTDTIHTTHGRAIAFATGAKLANPKLNVIVIGGDGDLADIGTNHLVHAARRNLNITVICVNNFLYGMTGGQTSSTTPHGAITSTSPAGNAGNPLDLIQLVLACGCQMATRHTVLTDKPRLVISAIKKAVRHPGFSFVELVAPCATHFTRKNGIFSPADLAEYLEANYLSEKKARKLSREAIGEKLICGIFQSSKDYLKLSEGHTQ